MIALVTTYDVVVVGSANLDRAIRVRRPPRPGETVLGDDVVEGPGGKGLNQAVACVRLGLSVAFVGAVGDDPAGRSLRTTLEDEGVVPLLHVAGVATGTAVVLTDDDGDSTIVVSPGANAAVTRDVVAEHAATIASARALLLQHEVPEAAVAAAVARAIGLVVLNPAPGRRVGADVLSRVDVLVPNAHELGVLAGLDGPPEDPAATATALGLEGAVVVTLGDRGCVVVTHDAEPAVVPAEEVTVVDATAAGDTFCAALVHGLLDGKDATAAARWATHAAAVTVTRAGAAGSVPRLDEL